MKRLTQLLLTILAGGVVWMAATLAVTSAEGGANGTSSYPAPQATVLPSPTPTWECSSQYLILEGQWAQLLLENDRLRTELAKSQRLREQERVQHWIEQTRLSQENLTLRQQLDECMNSTSPSSSPAN